jgi:hypothetical protein
VATGESVFHEEQRFRNWWAWALLAIADAPLVAVLVLTRTISYSLGLAAIVVTLVAALFLVARLVVDVTADEITISFHFLWPTRRIRMPDITRAHATKYNSLLEYGGYGVRLGFKGWAFNTGGNEGVLVETNDGKRVMIGSRRAKELEDAIARAVARQRPPG